MTAPLNGLLQYDPTGISQMMRAKDHRFQYTVAHPTDAIGPLPDPRWEGYFQALDDAGVQGIQGAPSTYNQSLPPEMQSNQLTGAPMQFSAGTELYGKGQPKFYTPPTSSTALSGLQRSFRT